MPRKKKDSGAVIPDYDSSYNPAERFEQYVVDMPFRDHHPRFTKYLHICPGMNVNIGTRFPKHGQLIKKVSGNAWLAELSDGSCEIIQRNDIQSARITDPYNFTEFVHVFEKGQIQTILIRAIQFKHIPNQKQRCHEVQYYENGKLVRISFYNQHERCNQEDHYENNKLVRTTFEEGHPKYKQVDHFQNGELVRTTFEEGHPRHGEVLYYREVQRGPLVFYELD